VNAHPVDSGRSVRDDGLVCCAVGDEQYALRGADVRQIVRVEKMLGAAGGDGRAGTLMVAGQAVPVFRLSGVLGRPIAPRDLHGAGQHIAVTGEPGQLVGWLVDRIVRTSLSKGTQVVALPAVVGPVATTWFEAVVKLGDSSVLLLAPQYLNPLVRGPVRYSDTRAFSAGTPATGSSAERMVLLFSTPALPRCAARRYALSGRRIAAIVQPLSPIVVPGSAPHVTGVAWWRDAVVPVIDFRGPGDHDDAAHGRRCVIAQCGARLGGTLVAFTVDAEIALHRPAAENRQAAGMPRPAFAVGMFDIDGEPVALLDLDTLLAPERPTSERIPA
jgi:chemotaxis signal transduction protein